MRRFFATIAHFFASVWNRTKLGFVRLWRFMQSNPMKSFLGILLVVFLLIVAGNFLRKPPQKEKAVAPVKHIRTYSIGSAPKMSVQAQIAKSGVIKIVAQTPGIVSRIYVSEGQSVKQGNWMVSLASNYQGGNAAGVQRQIAETQYKNIKDTYDLQKDLISKQREIAEKSESNANELRDITDKSLDDTRSLLSMNEEILGTVNDTIRSLEEANREATTSGELESTSQAIFAQKQLRAQYQSAVNQIRSGLRSAEYQADENKPPAELAKLQKELALKQLEVQEKTLEMSKEISGLQVKLARISEAMMYPASPFAGTVERVHVRVGQTVNPGTPIVTLSGNVQDITAFAMVPAEIAANISQVEPSTLHLGNKRIDVVPGYISNEATDGQLYSVIYTIPDEYRASLTDNSFIRIDIPIGYPDTGAAIPFVPIDAVYQTQDKAYIYITNNDKADSREVTLGNVFGRFVEIEKGLEGASEIIISRNVVTGDKVAKDK